MVRNALFVGLSAGIIAVGCSLLNPLDGYSGGATDAVAPPADVVAQQDTSIPDTSTSDAGCISARPPLRPPPSGNPDGGSTTVVVAISSFELGEKSDPKVPMRSGYDLDLLCTCPGPRACVPKSGAGVCDLPSGVDNSGGAWLLGLASLQSESAFGRGVSSGAEGLLMRIRNYNDLPDDDDVEVALFDTFGAEAFQPDAGGGPLKRDGTDRWTVDAKSLLGGTPYLPVAVDTRAYIRGGVMVAEIRFPFRVGDFTFPISAGYATASLVKLPTGYALENGILSGRLNASEFLTAFETLASSAPGPGFLCGADPIYASLRDGFCRVLDVPTDPTTDGREGPCDAVSLVIGFGAFPAVLGNVVQRPRPPRPCGTDWVGRCP